MTLWQAIVLGIIQGLTEFLPISSTAHLKVVPSLLGWEDPGAAFTAVIQWGTLLAVIIYFADDIRRILFAMLAALNAGTPFATVDARLGWMIGLGTLPVVVFGLLFQKPIETTLRSLYVISATAISLALLLLLAEWLLRRRERAGVALKELEQLGWRDAFLTGCAQAVALLPGASRSGTTITGGLFLGMTRETAARFSFLLSLPAIFAAGVHQLYKHRVELLATQESMLNLAVSTLVSGVVGYAAIAWLLGYLKRHSTFLFIAYRIVMGLTLLALLQAGVLQDAPPPANAAVTSADTDAAPPVEKTGKP